ncbi:Putative Methylase involved in ubiquinone/menaquinone biosynthesis [Podospora comata]|uniref:Methylase involved in ubiquinone/menaquinone biosynthesis n=1 Tax=Podospora comata TaxID=48703 RepID=A0ABY6SB21_PODCO|nr:Putative Methylase involved in ubiquinone/menaquinone biosynthesis [Podospora comata]
MGSSKPPSSPAAPSSPPAAAAEAGTHGEEAAPIIVDPEFETEVQGDGDSALGYAESSTASLSSSILQYREIHGRTYQNFKEAEYWAPNDDKQNDGLDLHHHMMYLIHNNSLFRSPVEDPDAVLDLGTGTGIWALDCADQFPAAEVIGTDLSPIQPTWTPPNCRFELDDASLDWTFSADKFDLVHLRFLIGSIEDWPKLYRQAYRCLKPGGWLEHTDFTIRIASDDGSIPIEDPKHPYAIWNRIFAEAGEKIGRTFLVSDKGKNAEWMKEAGFPGPFNVEHYKLPLGTWPKDKKWKEVGAFNKQSCLEGLEGYVLYLAVKILGWKFEEVQVLCSKMRSALANPNYHAYYGCSTVWTQKPLDEQAVGDAEA